MVSTGAATSQSADGSERVVESADARVRVVARAGVLTDVRIGPAPLGRPARTAEVAGEVLAAIRAAVAPAVGDAARGSGADAGSAPAAVGAGEQAVATLGAARVRAFAARRFDGADDAREVVATVDAVGSLIDLDVSVHALRTDPDAVGPAVVQAVGRAVSAQRAAREQEFGLSDLAARLQERTDAFGERMAELTGRLDELERRLAGSG